MRNHNLTPLPRLVLPPSVLGLLGKIKVGCRRVPPNDEKIIIDRFLKASKKIAERNSVFSGQLLIRKQLIEDMKSALPFNESTASLVSFIKQNATHDGQCFQVLRVQNRDVRDIVFKIEGYATSRCDFSVTPESLRAASAGSRRSFNRYRVRVKVVKEQGLHALRAKKIILKRFYSCNGPSNVALRTKKKFADSSEKTNFHRVEFPALCSSSDVTFSFHRYFSQFGDKIDECMSPGWPAGIPDDDEIIEHDLRKGGNKFHLLPMVPVFKLNSDGAYSLIDARRMESIPKERIEVFFRLKQTVKLFRNKVNSYATNKIQIEPSIVSVCLKENMEDSQEFENRLEMQAIKDRNKYRCF